jgi:hypothetical protein
MPSPAPGPRLPLEPAERPFYTAPGRIGCSGVAVVSVVALLAFFFCLRVIAPLLTQRISEIELPIPPGLGLETPAPTATTADAGLSGLRTPLSEPALTPTLGVEEPTATEGPPPTPPPTPAPPTAPPPSPTPAGPPPEYVAVANTDGTGVYLRADPRPDGRRIIAVPEKTLLRLVGPDSTVNGQVWRNVQTTKGVPQTGWVLAQYLTPAPSP